MGVQGCTDGICSWLLTTRRDRFGREMEAMLAMRAKSMGGVALGRVMVLCSVLAPLEVEAWSIFILTPECAVFDVDKGHSVNPFSFPLSPVLSRTAKSRVIVVFSDSVISAIVFFVRLF